METIFLINSHSKGTPKYLSLGPTAEDGTIVYGSFLLEGEWQPCIPYQWKEIEKFFEEKTLFSETSVSLHEVRKYCGNANQAIASVDGSYVCRFCGPFHIYPHQLLQKEEEHYCDLCKLS